MLRQLTSGFVPFVHAPQRVAFSWDMFSVPITRCTVDYVPPIQIGHRVVAHMHDTGQVLEWDPVFDRAEDYALAAREGCEGASRWTTATVTCFFEDGRMTSDAIRCP